MASVIYNSCKKWLMSGGIDFDSDNIYCALFPSSYTPDIDTDTVWDDISSQEITGTGYTTGGAQLTGCTVLLNLSTDKAIFDADDVTWESSTITARYAVLYRKAGSADSWLIAAFDFGSDKSSSGGDFSIIWNAAGIIDLY